MKGKRLEDRTCEWFREHGYTVEQTPYQKDGGVDVYATRSFLSTNEKLAIQCKDTATVGVNVARELYGVICSDPTITGGAIFTTGTFTKGCQEFCEKVNIALQVLEPEPPTETTPPEEDPPETTLPKKTKHPVTEAIGTACAYGCFLLLVLAVIIILLVSFGAVTVTW